MSACLPVSNALISRMEPHKVPTSEVEGIPPMMSKMVMSCVEWMKGSSAAFVFEDLRDLSVGNLGQQSAIICHQR